MTDRDDKAESGLTPAGRSLDPFRQPVHTLQMSVRQRGRSHLNGPVWKLVLIIAALSLLPGLLTLFGEDSTLRLWLTLPVASVAWFLAVRMLLLDTAIRRFWIGWLGISLIGLPISGAHPAGYLITSSFAVVFLLGRRYRPYRHLTSRRRAVVFLCGLIAFIAMSVTERIPSQGSSFLEILRFTTNYAGLSLSLFWFFSLLTLFFGMRLHFMRLRPKLAVTGLLLLLVPFVLIISLAGVALFGAIGGSRAAQGRYVIEEWMDLANSTPEAAREIFGEPLDPLVEPASTVMAAMTRGEFAGADTTVLVHLGEEVYAWRSPRGEDSALVYAFGTQMEQRLSRLLDCEVSLESRSTFTVETSGSGIRFSSGEETDGEEDEDGEMDIAEDAVTPQSGEASADTTESTTIHLGDVYRVRELAYFGATPIQVATVSGDSLRTKNVLLTLKARPIDVAQSYVSQENPVTLAVVVILGVIAGLFLILEALALFFGLRIVGGITSAVRALHRGTERVSRGELDTRIELLNEDEFGDLADSFNEMTAAIRVGQEQAVQRERLEQELLLARKIQERLLPSGTPQVKGYQIAGTSIPSLLVGGDYFDFIDLGDGRLGIAVGDVSGKGIPAAMLMSNLHASLHGQVMHPSSVGEIVQRINTLLARSTDPHMFATFIFGVLDTRTGELVFANAGHDSPVLVRGATGAVERPGGSDLILGMLAGQSYQESKVRLNTGDVLVLYTDGVSEAVAPPLGARDHRSQPPETAAKTTDLESAHEAVSDVPSNDEEFFGEDKLVEVVRRRAGSSAHEIQLAVIDAVRNHAAGHAQSDDITLVVIKRESSDSDGTEPGSASPSAGALVTRG